MEKNLSKDQQMHFISSCLVMSKLFFCSMCLPTPQYTRGKIIEKAKYI